MSWFELMMVLVTFCGGSHSLQDATICRAERLKCIERGANFDPKNNAIQLVNACLSDPTLFKETPKPLPSPSPKVSIVPVKKTDKK